VTIVTGVRQGELYTATLDDTDTVTTTTMIASSGLRTKTAKHSVLTDRLERSVRSTDIHVL